MLSEQLEHVIEKRQSSVDLGTTCAIKIQFYAHVRFFGLAPDLSYA
jgi:hypothetical protein